MFIVAQMTDTVKTEPDEFSRDFQKSLEKSLNAKFANKVVLNVGLCICFYDFEKIYDSYILPGDGSCYTKVDFRMTFFRPFVDEILTGKIKGCDRDGIAISMGFFDDIFVRAENLPVPSKFEGADFLWYWEYKDGEDTSQRLYMDPGKQIRFRVLDQVFSDTAPLSNSVVSSPPPPSADTKQPAPYIIIASMSEPGLGPLVWWESQQEEEIEENNESS